MAPLNQYLLGLTWLLGLPGAAAALEIPQACSRLMPLANAGTDCAVYWGDEDRRAVVFDFSADGSVLTVRQVLADGTIAAQSAPLAIGAAYAVPAMMDLNGDGVMELLVPGGGHGDDIGYDIWTESDAAPVFVPYTSLVTTAFPHEMQVHGDLLVIHQRFADGQAVITGMSMSRDGFWDAYIIEVKIGDPAVCDVSIGEVGRAKGLDADAMKAECEARAWT